MVVPRLLNEVLEALKSRAEVEAVLLQAGTPEWEVFVYLTAPLAVDFRRTVLSPRSTLLDLEVASGEPSDDGELNDGTVYRLVYRTLDDLAERIARVVEKTEISVSASTGLWNHLQTSVVAFDRGRAAALKARFSQAYPAALKAAVVKKHAPLLRRAVVNYHAQVVWALKSSDWFAVQHRTAAFLASVFELVFAANGATHPGSRRLVELSSALPLLPSDWSALLAAVDRANAGSRTGLPDALDKLAAAVDVFLVRQSLLETPAAKLPAGRTPPPAASAQAVSAKTPSTGILSVYTDGGCIGNPGKGAWAYLVDDGDLRVEDTDGDPLTTNNKMELQAVISALAAISAKPEWKGRPIRIHTDSQYVRNGITAWIKTWSSNGWKTAAKEPVKNQDLWMELQKWDKALNPEWKWVKGHAGNPNNERCDALVRRTMDQM